MAHGSTFGIPWPEYNAGLIYNDTISVRDQAKTLLEFYCLRHKQSASAEGWMQRIRNEQIRVDGEVASRPDAILRMGASLEYHRLPWREPAVPHLLQVFHEDNDLVVLNKPAGLQVLPGGLFQQRTILTQLQWRDVALQYPNPSPASNELYATSPVHRLGRGTSGVLLCAKTPQAKSKLAADLAEGTESTTRRTDTRRTKQLLDMSERRFSKTYRALASGLIELDEITVDQPIGRVPYAGVAGGLYMASTKGKPSLSKVLVLWRNKQDNCTLVQVEILTGRPHQIRIHLASIGHPLLGDPLYMSGGRPFAHLEGSLSESAHQSSIVADDGGYSRPSTALPGDIGYLLHAWRLEFYHPISEEKLLVIAPPPSSLQVPGEQL
ncbi:unnamed protein product [Calypogeia fissa]